MRTGIEGAIGTGVGGVAETRGRIIRGSEIQTRRRRMIEVDTMTGEIEGGTEIAEIETIHRTEVGDEAAATGEAMMTDPTTTPLDTRTPP